MNVDQSITSDVINELFDDALEESDEHSGGGDDDDEEGEEDALNISSMSILTPLVETVAAAVKSPERRMMVRGNVENTERALVTCLEVPQGYLTGAGFKIFFFYWNHTHGSLSFYE